MPGVSELRAAPTTRGAGAALEMAAASGSPAHCKRLSSCDFPASAGPEKKAQKLI